MSRLSSCAFSALVTLLGTAHAHAALVELTDAFDIQAGGSVCVLVYDSLVFPLGGSATGGVKCWGNGPLGDGTSYPRSVAVDVMGLTSGVKAVAVGRGAHSCVVLASGAMKCWGLNEYGQLGDGSTARRLIPADVQGISGAIAAAAGMRHTCALLDTGAVKCWGANDRGQLGTGATGTPNPLPQDVNGLAGAAIDIAAGPEHTCVIISGGGAQCWGSNVAGELGDGTTTNRASPVFVQGLPGVIAIAPGGTPLSVTPPGFISGGGHTCAVTGAGGAKCWGLNGSGNLGDGTTATRLTPVDVVTLTNGAADIATGGIPVYFSATTVVGYAHSCAVTTSGAAKCWGNAQCGQLGNGGVAGACSPVPNGDTFSAVPVDVVGLSSGTARIAAGAGFTCALTTQGRAKCWGYGDALGNGGRVQGSSTPVAVLTGTLPQAIVWSQHGPVPIGSTDAISATGGNSDNPVTFTSLTPGICSVSGTTVTRFGDERPSSTAIVTGLASGLCTIAANQAGNANHDPAPQLQQTFRIGDPLQQAITFGAAPTVPVKGVGTLTATASSGLKVFYSSNTPGTCSVDGSTVSGIAVGSCTITASQPGDELYAPAPQVTQTFTVTENTGTVVLTAYKIGPGFGTVVSSPSGIDCGAVCGGNFANSSSVTLSATASPGSKFAGWTAPCSGTGTCTVFMRGILRVGATFVLDSPITRLANISTRGQVVSSGNAAPSPLIAGFIVGGTVSKTVVITAAGPSLVNFGVSQPLPNPTLTLVRSSDSFVVATNDDWQSGDNAAGEGSIGKSGFAPSNPLEPALKVTLAPGAYTAIVDAPAGQSGTALVGVFEFDRPEVPLINISTRGRVGTGDDVMIAGFIIQGSDPQRVVVNVAGPSLENFVGDPLANPTLTLVRSSDNLIIAENDDWQGQNPDDVQALFNSGFQPNHKLEPAIIATLPPGAYTAIVRGVAGSTGTGLVGVFRVAP